MKALIIHKAPATVLVTNKKS